MSYAGVTRSRIIVSFSNPDNPMKFYKILFIYKKNSFRRGKAIPIIFNILNPPLPIALKDDTTHLKNK